MTEIPLYINIANQMKEQILNGTYAYHQLLPSENTLALHFHVSRVTIRQALKVLQDQDLISKQKGKGTFVLYENLQSYYQKSTKILPFSKEMALLRKSVSSSIELFEFISCPQNLCKNLKLTTQDKVIHSVRIRYADSLPVCVEDFYLDACKYGDISIEDLLHSKYDYFENKKGLTIAYSHQVIRCKSADKLTAKYLKIEKGTPIISTHQTTYLDNGKILEFSIIDFAPNRYEPHYIKWRR